MSAATGVDRVRARVAELHNGAAATATEGADAPHVNGNGAQRTADTADGNTPPRDPAANDVPPPSDEHAPPQQRQRIDPNDPRPEIVLSTDQPPIVEAAMVALARLGDVYVRGRQLVHVVRDHGAPDWWKRPEGAPVIVAIERDHLLDLLGRAARWFVLKEDGPKKASPPAWVAARLLARGQWRLPQLEGIADSPVFRADGSIHDQPGYDPATRVIYDPGRVVFQTIPRAPTKAEAKRALAELLEPFDEFPFLAESDKAATAAAILSVIGRAAIPGNVPMFSSQAPTPGSSKGLLVEVVSVIATGRKPPLMSPTADDDEVRKRLMAIAIESPTMVVIDNVEHEIGSASLAMALTAGVVTDRKFGDNTKMITASLRPVWIMTGNNVRLKGDLGRRVVPIDLDAKCEHPEDRTFKRADLIDYVQANRPRFVVAALTVLRAFVVAGRPAHGWSTKGSFEQWSELVRGAIAHAGGADPLGGVQRIREQGDEDLDKLRTLLAAWHATFEGTAATMSQAIEKAGDSGDLHHALAAFCRSNRPEARPIGNALRQARGRIVSGRSFERSGEDRNGVALWKVVSTTYSENSAGSAGSAGSSSRPTESDDESSGTEK